MEVEAIGPGMQKIGLSGGGVYMRIHYSADPGKRDPAWKARVSQGIPVREWRREMELDDTVYDGEPVFPEYRDIVHCIERASRNRVNSIPIFEQSMFLGLWDAGNTLHPAFTLMQITVDGQVLLMGEIEPDTPEAMESFAPRVNEYLRKNFPTIKSELRHFGDETIKARQGATGKSAADIARKHGFAIAGVSNCWEDRRSSVSWLLLDMLDEHTPRFMISETACPIAVAGFRGAYRLRTHSGGDDTGPGAAFGMPLKDGYSHVQDSIQYGAVIARRWLTTSHTENVRGRFRTDGNEEDRKLRKMLGIV